MSQGPNPGGNPASKRKDIGTRYQARGAGSARGISVFLLGRDPSYLFRPDSSPSCFLLSGPAPTDTRKQPELTAATQNGVKNRSKPFKTFQTRVNWEKDPARIERYDPKWRPKPVKTARTRTNSKKDPARTERYAPKWRPKPVKTIQNRPDPRQLRERSSAN